VTFSVTVAVKIGPLSLSLFIPPSLLFFLDQPPAHSFSKPTSTQLLRRLRLSPPLDVLTFTRVFALSPAPSFSIGGFVQVAHCRLEDISTGESFGFHSSLAVPSFFLRHSDRPRDVVVFRLFGSPPLISFLQSRLKFLFCDPSYPRLSQVVPAPAVFAPGPVCFSCPLSPSSSASLSRPPPPPYPPRSPPPSPSDDPLRSGDPTQRYG